MDGTGEERISFDQIFFTKKGYEDMFLLQKNLFSIIFESKKVDW